MDALRHGVQAAILDSSETRASRAGHVPDVLGPAALPAGPFCVRSLALREQPIVRVSITKHVVFGRTACSALPTQPIIIKE
jgi:hypothetical protein